MLTNESDTKQTEKATTETTSNAENTYNQTTDEIKKLLEANASLIEKSFAAFKENIKDYINLKFDGLLNRPKPQQVEDNEQPVDNKDIW